MKSNELLRMLRKDGWYDVRQNGSHILMRHHFKSGQFVVPDHGSKEGQERTVDCYIETGRYKNN
ncbi:type II toxin-antitoxin system HicA family toxin [Dyadobacter sp. MSC1_007]|jgi:predicted RNA binding protein YcfA (HicA-like mRNA interferase family)|uniref:type II toxin-antitoxin system HicA family toxin n=1 Tax=Dyadobacter sp. MSC1_007 TaxID=2909264 RepID=UPI00202FD479|nr:type II toxin-antitoxin system HicA family toxin [Dyadobacter sp. MSC1_007]